MPVGRIVLLNGASSAGKTSIVQAFRDQQARGGAFWFPAGIDDVLSKVRSEWLDVGWPQGAGVWAADGMRIVGSESDRRLEVGPLLRRLLRVYQRGVADAAAAGADVIVDEVVLDRTASDDWKLVLAGAHALWVGVHCAIAELEERERRRGDRPIGLARAQLATVHRHAQYDLEIDTASTQPHMAADRIRTLLRA